MPRPWRLTAMGLLVAAALGLTWTLYTDPHFMVSLADQVWACF